MVSYFRVNRFVCGGDVETSQWASHEWNMETENPYQPPSSDAHPIGQEAKPSAPSSFRVFVVRGTIAGLAIGSGIYAIRCISNSPARWAIYLHGTRRYATFASLG